MWNEYPHSEKCPVANLKDEPGERSLGSSTVRRKPTKTSSTLIGYCPSPTHSRGTQPGQRPVCVRRPTRAWWRQAPVATHPLQVAGRPGPAPHASHRRGISTEGIQESRLQQLKQPWSRCLLQGPGSSSMRSSRGKGIFTLGPFQDLQALSHREQQQLPEYPPNLLPAGTELEQAFIPACRGCTSLHFAKKGNIIPRIH